VYRCCGAHACQRITRSEIFTQWYVSPVRHRRTRSGYRPVKNVAAKVSTFLNRLLALRMADQVRPTLAALYLHETV